MYNMKKAIISLSLYLAVVGLLNACDKADVTTDDNRYGTITEISGTVISDTSSLCGRITDADGNPVQSVVVSDGTKCVLTDKNGVYQFDRYKKARFVYYSVPEGYEVVRSSDGYPSFYALIDRKSNPARHDFTLGKRKDAGKFTFVCIADPQCLNTSDLNRYVNETIPDVEETSMAAAEATTVIGTTLGDIIFDSPDLWNDMKKSMSNLSLPLFQVIGNHDHLASESSDDASAVNYEDQFGPRDYSYNLGKAHIVAMDNVLYLGNKKYNGGFTDRQIKWLEQDLKFVPEDRLVILCTHMPFRSLSSKTDESQKNGRAVLDLLSRFKEVHLMIGHTHYNEVYVHNVNGKEIIEHIHGAACGGWWASGICSDGTPNGYAVYELDGPTISNYYYKGTGLPAENQLRAYPSAISYGQKLSYTFGWGPMIPNDDVLNNEKGIVVNIWNAITPLYKSEDVWKVELWQDGAKVADMTRFTSPEYWAFGQFVIKHGKSDTNTWKANRNHLYKAVLNRGNAVTDTDADLNFEVRVTDQFGNVYKCNTLTKEI